MISVRRVLAILLFLLSAFYPIVVSAQLSRLLDTASTYEYSKNRVSPLIYYSNPDRIFAGIKFRLARVAPRNDEEGYPYGFDQSVQARYSISQNAFSLLYDGKFYQLIGHWNLSVSGYYDWMIWTNFFGLGNDTK